MDIAIKPYKEFREKWEPLIGKIESLTKDPYYSDRMYEGCWRSMISHFNEIINTERTKVLSTLTDEQRKALGF